MLCIKRLKKWTSWSLTSGYKIVLPLYSGIPNLRSIIKTGKCTGREYRHKHSKGALRNMRSAPTQERNYLLWGNFVTVLLWKLQKRILRWILAGMKSWKCFKNHTNGVCTPFHSGHQTGPLSLLKGSTYKFSNLRPRGPVSRYQCENISNFDILACRNFRTSL